MLIELSIGTPRIGGYDGGFRASVSGAGCSEAARAVGGELPAVGAALETGILKHVVRGIRRRGTACGKRDIVDVELIARGGIVGKPEHQAGVVHRIVEVFSGESKGVGLPTGSEVGDCRGQSVVGVRCHVLLDRYFQVVTRIGVGGEIELISRVGFKGEDFLKELNIGTPRIGGHDGGFCTPVSRPRHVKRSVSVRVERPAIFAALETGVLGDVFPGAGRWWWLGRRVAYRAGRSGTGRAGSWDRVRNFTRIIAFDPIRVISGCGKVILFPCRKTGKAAAGRFSGVHLVGIITNRCAVIEFVTGNVRSTGGIPGQGNRGRECRGQ